MSNQGRKIHIIEDEEDIVAFVQFALTKHGFSVSFSLNGEEGLQTVLASPPDLLLLDLMLPGRDGIDICRHLRAQAPTADLPIIMMTAKGTDADVIGGLGVGADDYIMKPFSRDVLIARVNVQLRRRGRREPIQEEQLVVVHQLVMHPGRMEARVGERKIDFTLSEFQILHFLASRPGWVYSRSQIVDAAKGENYSVTDRSVDVQIVAIRKKLGEFGEYVETVRGVGYRLKE